MQPLHVELAMGIICLIVVPYLYISFKRMWSLSDNEEHFAERRRIGRRIAILLGILATLVFLLPLLLKYFGETPILEE